MVPSFGQNREYEIFQKKNYQFILKSRRKRKEGPILIWNLETEQSSQSNPCCWWLTHQTAIPCTYLQARLLLVAASLPSINSQKNCHSWYLLAGNETKLSIILHMIVVLTAIAIHLYDWFHRSYEECCDFQTICLVALKWCCVVYCGTWRPVTYSTA